MTSHHEDEAMLRDVRHLRHRARGSAGLGSFALIAVLGIWIGARTGWWASPWLFWPPLLLLALGAALLAGLWVGRMKARARDRMGGAFGAERERETDRLLLEMKAREDERVAHQAKDRP